EPESFDFSGDPRRKRARVKERNRRHTAFPAEQGGPGGFHISADGSDHSHSRHNNTSHKSLPRDRLRSRSDPQSMKVSYLPRRSPSSSARRVLISTNDQRGGLAVGCDIDLDEDGIAAGPRLPVDDVQLAKRIRLITIESRWNESTIGAFQAADQ